MTDRIDYANAQSEQILAMQIKKTVAQTTPNDITECIDCGEPIGEKRKAVAPYAVRCISCQDFFERKAGRTIGGGR